jgi:autotransporter-associated beta strand protein
MTIQGGGNFTLTGSNNSSGTININNGSTLVVDSANEMPQFLNFIGNGTGTLHTLSGFSTSTPINVSGTAIIQVDSGTFSVENMSGSFFSMTKTGGGILQFPSSSIISGVGFLGIQAGSLLLDTVPSVGTYVLSGGALVVDNGFNFTIPSIFRLNNSSSFIQVNPGSILTLTNTVTGPSDLVKMGIGRLNLSGSNSYDGITAVNAGILSIANTAGLDNTLNTSVSSGATLDMNFNGTLGNHNSISLSDVGVGGLGVLTFSNNSTLTNPISLVSDSTIGGTGIGKLNGIISGNFNLTKAGVGTLTLGASNNYGGMTNINGGILSISADTNLGSAPSSATPAWLNFNGGS